MGRKNASGGSARGGEDRSRATTDAPRHDEPQRQPNASPTSRPASGNADFRSGSARGPDAALMPDARLTSLSVVLPCHDEEGTSPTAVREAGAAARARPSSTRSSSSTTAAPTRPPRSPRLRRRDPHVRVLVHDAQPRLRRGPSDRIAAARCLDPPHGRRPPVRPRRARGLRRAGAPTTTCSWAIASCAWTRPPAAQRVRVEPARRPRVRPRRARRRLRLQAHPARPRAAPALSRPPGR